MQPLLPDQSATDDRDVHSLTPVETPVLGHDSAKSVNVTPLEFVPPLMECFPRVPDSTNCNVGSFVAYYVGALGGRPLVEKYGRYVLMTRHDLGMADRFFARYGDWAVFIARLLPVVRTFIALPAGI